MEIWDKRRHICDYCLEPLPDEPKTYNFDHILEKGIYKTLRHKERNIALTCLRCHGIKTSHRYTSRMIDIIFSTVRYFIQMGDLVEVGKENVFRLKDWIKEAI